MSSIISHYFPDLTANQKTQFEKLYALYVEWNAKINVISRKDIDNLYVNHVLHSLGIAKVQTFLPGSSILDVGTGGGFPGIPLAILFPEVQFHLVDSIGKKITVVTEVSKGLGLRNVKAEHIRAEQIKGEYDNPVKRILRLGTPQNQKAKPAPTRKRNIIFKRRRFRRRVERIKTAITSV
jgi:16S rRNA (guanine527-N7)-methyltransferase